MAFTALLVTIVAGLLNLATIAASLTVATDYGDFRTIAVLIAGKIGSAALVIYMFFKVFDLAAALGGGLNMGNNLVAGARAISHDMARGIAGSDRGMGRARGGGNNQIRQGRSAASAGSSGQAGSANRGSAMQQIARNRTFTGMAATAGVLGVAAGARMLGGTARSTVNEARIAGRAVAAGAGAAGRGVMAMGAGAVRAVRAMGSRQSG